MTPITFTPANGIATEEVGTVSGPLAASTSYDPASDQTIVSIAYEGADETYTVSGGPLSGDVPLADIVAWLSRDAGRDTDDNKIVISLDGYQS